MAAEQRRTGAVGGRFGTATAADLDPAQEPFIVALKVSGDNAPDRRQTSAQRGCRARWKKHVRAARQPGAPARAGHAAALIGPLLSEDTRCLPNS